MIETYLKSYNELSLDSKREILLKEVSEILFMYIIYIKEDLASLLST